MGQRLKQHIWIQRERIETSVLGQFLFWNAFQLRFETIIVALWLNPFLPQHLFQKNQRAYFRDEAVEQTDFGFGAVEFHFPHLFVQTAQQPRQVSIAERVAEGKSSRLLVARDD